MEDSSHPGGVLGPYAAAIKAALMQPFLRLNFATLWVRDQEQSRRFFVEKLGFEVIVDVSTGEGDRWIVVAPTAAGWLSGSTGASLPGVALVVPPEGSPERQRIGQNLGFAVFVDAGQVSKDVNPFDSTLDFGAGAGARYYTPIGPLRLDVAVPVKRRRNPMNTGFIDDPFELYIGLGQAF